MKKLWALIVCLVLASGVAQAEAQLLKVKEKIWTQQQMQDAFLGGQQVEMTQGEYGLEYEPPVGEDQPMMLCASRGYLQFKSDKLHVEDSLALYSLDKSGASNDGALEGLSLEQALTTVRDACQVLGIEPGAVIRHSALDGAGLEDARQRYVMDLRQRTGFGDSQEALLLSSKAVKDEMARIPLPPEGYLIRLAVNYQGVPCQCPLKRSDSLDGNALNPNYLLAYVTAEGMLLFESNSELYEVVDAKPAGDAALSLEQAQAQLNLAPGYTAAFEYMPMQGKNNTIVLHPAWVFYPEDGS